MKKRVKIIFFAQDPGGFNALWPVIKRLKKKGNILSKVVLANESREIAKKRKINFRDAGKLSQKSLIKLIQRGKPDLVFTATSLGLSVEKVIIKIAKKQGVKTAAIIDFWANYKLRFSDPGTENLAYLPDYILVIDEIMKKEMVKEGFDLKRIFVSGNPYFSTFLKEEKNNKKERIITFFSQPFSELFKKGEKGHLGYSEVEVFEDLTEVLEKLKIELPVKLKLHPRTKKKDKFNKVISNSKLKINVEKKQSSETLIKKSKLVIGMNSAILFQAALMGKPVISYQPNLKGSDPLISNRLRVSKAVYKKENLYQAIKQALSECPQKNNFQIIKKYIIKNSVGKVITLINKIINGAI